MLLAQVGWNQSGLDDKLVCENAILLLSADSDCKLLELNTENPPDSLIAQKESGGFCIALPFENVDVNLPLNTWVNDSNDSIINCFNRKAYYTISLNRVDKILFEGNIASLDSLKKDIKTYYSSVGNTQSRSPEKLETVHFLIEWQSGSSKKTVEKILSIICSAYLEAIEQHQNIVVCDMTAQEIEDTKANYPLKISIKNKNSDVRIDEIQIIEDSEDQRKP